MENLKNFAMGRLSAADMLEDKEDMKVLYNQVFGACEFYANYGRRHAEIAKEIWEEFSWKFNEIYYEL